MPAGVSWNTYLKGVAVMLVSMAAGSQTVHLMYKPLEDLDELVKKEKEKILRQQSGDMNYVRQTEKSEFIKGAHEGKR
ncbi:ubiquinol-cytochrome c reductase complex assembly factor 6-like [Mytilus galloprovincialis]|uniref:ubiquinol-cytochrome c reductase complex assembly factor 6-like n=1 Tax=Mytilus galloprovincialis TaxID=29158 RepID=UPI003F7B7935